jgi:hypothetical protein
VYYSHVADHHGDPYTNITNILVRRRADVTSTFGVTVVTVIKVNYYRLQAAAWGCD